MTPAHPQPIPWILAKPQLAYTAITVATLFNQAKLFKILQPNNDINGTKILWTHQPCDYESKNKQKTRAFKKRPTPGPCYEDKCLTNNAYLKVKSCGELIRAVPY